MLTFHAPAPTAQLFTITYSDGSAVYTQNNVQDAVPFIVATQPLVSTTYSLLSVQVSASCPPTVITGQTATISVGKCICDGTAGVPIVNTDFGSGANPGPALSVAAAGATTTYVNVSVSGNPASPTPVDGEYSITTMFLPTRHGSPELRIILQETEPDIWHFTMPVCCPGNFTVSG